MKIEFWSDFKLRHFLLLIPTIMVVYEDHVFSISLQWLWFDLAVDFVLYEKSK